MMDLGKTCGKSAIEKPLLAVNTVVGHVVSFLSPRFADLGATFREFLD